MNVILRSLTSFLKGSAGAITVDYVVLTAAATATAIAANDVIRGGLATLAGNVTSETTGRALDDPSNAGLEYTESFANGANGWLDQYGGEFGTQFINGAMSLGPIAGSNRQEAVTREFNLADGLSHSTISFDMLAMDSLDDGDTGLIFIGGQAIGELVRTAEETSFVSFDVPGVSVAWGVVEHDVPLGGNSNWNDSRVSFNITYEEPDPYLTVGFGSSADQGSGDESFAIQNISVTGIHDPDRPAEESSEPTG